MWVALSIFKTMKIIEHICDDDDAIFCTSRLRLNVGKGEKVKGYFENDMSTSCKDQSRSQLHLTTHHEILDTSFLFSR